MFERFTEKAIKVILLAQEESRRMGHHRVGTEQLLLGLIGEGSGIAGKALASVGISLPSARNEVEHSIGRGPGDTPVEIPFTTRGKLAMEAGWECARQLGQTYVGTEHLLLGILKQTDSTAMEILRNMHADVEDLRRRVYSLLPDVKAAELPAAPMVPDAIGDLSAGAFFWYRLDAITTMKRAKALAQMLGHCTVRSGHLFMSLLQDETPVTAHGAGADLAGLRAEILASLQPEAAMPGAGTMPIADDAQAVLRQAWLAAVELGISRVSNDVLILGLLHDTAGEPTRMLNAAGGDAAKLAGHIRETIRAAQHVP